MLFSIVVPVYNVEKYIKECLDSIFNQDFDDYEVVLVDDGSTDESGKICDEYSKIHDNTKVIHKKNQGLISARREGYRYAEGEYIINCDSDDYLEADALKSLYKIIKRENPDLIVFNSYIAHEEHRDILNEHLFPEGDIEKKQLFDMFLMNAQANSLCMKTYKRNILDIESDYSNFYKINYGEDLLQSIPLVINADRIYYLDRQLYNYRVGVGMMSKYNSLQYWSFKTIYFRLQDALKIVEIDEPENKLSKFLVTSAYDAIHINKEVGEYHQDDVIRIASDKEFIDAYNRIKRLKYIQQFTIKQRIILILLHLRFWGALKWLFMLGS